MTPFQNQIIYAKRQLENIIADMEMLTGNVDVGNMDRAYEDAFDLAYDCERLTLIARQLPAHTGQPLARQRIEEETISAIAVDVGYTRQGWFGLRIPALLPKKDKGNADYIRTSVYLALDNYYKRHPRVRFRECVIVFRHRYQQERPERWARDHDNIEINTVTDSIALFLLEDDSALLCNHYYCSAPGDSNETEVFIVPQQDFRSWLKLYGKPGAASIQFAK